MSSFSERNVRESREATRLHCPLSEEAEAARDKAPPIQLEELYERCLGNLSLVERVLETFEEQFGPHVSQLQQALSASDVPTISRIAHKLKGASSNVSAGRLQRVMQAIEEAAGENRLDVVQQALSELEQEWAEVSRFLSMLSDPPDTPPETAR